MAELWQDSSQQWSNKKGKKYLKEVTAKERKELPLSTVSDIEQDLYFN